MPGSPPAPPAARLTLSKNQCSDLQKRNLPCPPNNLQVVQAPIINATGGAVQDNQAQEWGKAVLLSETYDDWAIGAGASDFLTGGADADSGAAQFNLFPQELQMIQKAKANGGQVIYQPLKLQRVAIVRMPQDLQTLIKNQQLIPKPYAAVGEVVGPGSLGIKNPNGSQDIAYSVPSGQIRRLLLWGEYRIDPDLGAIWYEEGVYDCGDAKVAPTCTQALG